MGKFFSKGMKYYRQSLLLILSIAILPGLLLSGFMYWGTGGEIEKKLHQLHQEEIHERAQTIDGNLAYLELSIGQWAFEPQFDYTLRGMDFGLNYGRAWDITKTLLIVQSSSELIENAELYVKGTDNQRDVRFMPEYSTVDESELNTQYMNLMNRNQSFFWTTEVPGSTNKEQLALVQKLPGNNKNPIGLLLVRINMEKLEQLVGALTPYNGGKTLIINDDGGRIISTGIGSDDDLLVQDLISEIQNGNQEEGLHYYRWNGSKYSISYDTFNEVSTHWSYISAAPIQAITYPLRSISKLIITISCIALLIAASMAWAASRRIYSPVGKLFHMLNRDKAEHLDQDVDEFTLINQKWQELNRESKSLQSKLKHELPHLKESFIQQLFQGYLHQYSASELIKRFSQYGVHLENKKFTVVYVQLIGLGSSTTRFNQGDEGLVTFAACNIMGEIAGNELEQTYVINFHDLSIALLIVEPGKDTREAIHALCSEITHGINQLLRLQATAVIAPSTNDIKQIASLYESAKSATRYRSFENENQIIDMEQPELLMEAGELNYPFTIERELIQALRAGEKDEAMHQLSLFIEALSVDGVKEMDVKQGVMRLLAGIINAISQLGVNPASLSKGSNLFEALSQIRDPNSIVDWFHHHIIESFICELERRTNDQVKRVIEKAKNYIRQNYMKDISLESCADHVKVASHFLSKVFKKETGSNFTEYLTELRMEKAKSLLRESDIMINEISLLVGYQPSYFIRLFKKLEGITPGRFREVVHAREE
ncbi:AraC family transcriptional regulator [Paenibacillus sp. HB172176]|uniref:AraC family transcriptional regulator n=1 Tax=Paenibacillus sp. HB172176 TaxID=2493690 RepID=UPI00143A8C52|nr:AraC family transcriptional regulator [Paenibacillus sp. HB172176]